MRIEAMFFGFAITGREETLVVIRPGRCLAPLADLEVTGVDKLNDKLKT